MSNPFHLRVPFRKRHQAKAARSTFCHFVGKVAMGTQTVVVWVNAPRRRLRTGNHSIQRSAREGFDIPEQPLDSGTYKPNNVPEQGIPISGHSDLTHCERQKTKERRGKDDEKTDGISAGAGYDGCAVCGSGICRRAG